MRKSKYDILEDIISYCNFIYDDIAKSDKPYDNFIINTTYQRSICLSLLQIGEEIANLTDEFIEKK
jgi:uncharacterized protein with HEPN domain